MTSRQAAASRFGSAGPPLRLAGRLGARSLQLLAGWPTLFLALGCQSAHSASDASAVELCADSAHEACSLQSSFDFAGASHGYVLHVPPHLREGAPLVLFLPGTGATAQSSEGYTQLDATADQAGFALAYVDPTQPNLSYPVWNVYFGGPIQGAQDDVEFIRQLIASLRSKLGSDPRRIYVAGFSIGAVMAERVGVELSDVVAAVASVEGTIEIDAASAVTPPRAAAPISVLLLHGDAADEQVPYCGGPNPQYGGNWSFASQEATFDYWSGPSANQCATLSPSAPLCDAARSSTSVHTKIATGCAGDSEVRLYRMLGGDHAWWSAPLNDPNSPPYNPDLSASTGVTSNDIIWRFFAAHPKR